MVKFEEFVYNITVDVPEELETADIAAGKPPTKLKFTEMC